MSVPSPRDLLWIERAKRRYGRLIQIGVRLPPGVKRDALLHACTWLVRCDRIAYRVLGS